MKLASDFSSLLDEAFPMAESAAEWRERGFSSFDPLSLASGSSRVPSVSAELLASEYLSLVPEDGEEESAGDDEFQPPRSIEPDEIAAELDLPGCDLPALARKRRDFAFDNHPDRASPRARAEALARMQIANALIDEAERKLLVAQG